MVSFSGERFVFIILAAVVMFSTILLENTSDAAKATVNMKLFFEQPDFHPFH